ncbi:unnamed protein product [Strongylus vulgaris]|uniref:Aldehyde dehydrogenase domain-containing protein n=1 Tax=Strongylus vulgaris TaxID=40348 RepID=A0A3P7JKI5_STRVU|nr:unnamed protein product [Strongylus vulgaris]
MYKYSGISSRAPGMLSRATSTFPRRFGSTFTSPLLPKGALAYINGISSRALGMLSRATSIFPSRFGSTFTSPLLPKGALAYINGHWVESQTRNTFDVTNPYSGDVLYKTVNCDVPEAKKVSSVYSVFRPAANIASTLLSLFLSFVLLFESFVISCGLKAFSGKRNEYQR